MAYDALVTQGARALAAMVLAVDIFLLEYLDNSGMD